jgi:aquaporin Z
VRAGPANSTAQGRTAPHGLMHHAGMASDGRIEEQRSDDEAREQLFGAPQEAIERVTGFDDPRRVWRRLFAEMLGTFLLVLAAAGGEMVRRTFEGSISLTAAVTAPALTVLAVILFMGKVSGAHLNPAVTLAFTLRKDFPWRRVPGYIAAQMLGAVIAAALLVVMVNASAREGATFPGEGISLTGALLVEVVLTFGLVSVILGTASGAQNIGVIGALGVGAYIAAAGLWAQPLSGASMNPARSFGPSIVAWDFTAWPAYLAGPLIGALLAVGAAWILRGPGGGVTGSLAAQGTIAPVITKPDKP